MLAHQMAVESPYIESEMVEATDFVALSEQYGVSSVPHTVINRGAGEIIGAPAEPYLLAEIQQAISKL